MEIYKYSIINRWFLGQPSYQSLIPLNSPIPPDTVRYQPALSSYSSKFFLSKLSSLICQLIIPSPNFLIGYGVTLEFVKLPINKWNQLHQGIRCWYDDLTFTPQKEGTLEIQQLVYSSQSVLA